jgi:putative IMPACT (imprinted ancient) family translation regulator
VKRLRVSVPYPLFPKAEFEWNQRNYRLENKDFGEQVTVTLLASPREKEALEAFLQDLSGGKIQVETVGECYAEEREYD